MLSFLNQYSYKGPYSQNGESGIIAEVLARIFPNAEWPMSAGLCVEVGGHDGKYCSNTALLIDWGWEGLFVEADYSLYQKCKANYADSPRVRVQCSRVDGHNINAFVDDRCDLLSIDTDGHDYDIFRGLIARPKIVIVEIDSSIEPPSERVNADGGVGYWTMTTLALEKGYFVLCHTGNLVLVRQDYGYLFPECKPHPLLEWETYFNRSWLKEVI